jgi:hypothetical protein
MTLNIFKRNSKAQARIERPIEIGAFILLTDGRFGTLVSIDMVQGEKRGYVEGHGFAASVVDGEIFAFRNMELVQTAVA